MRTRIAVRNSHDRCEQYCRNRALRCALKQLRRHSKPTKPGPMVSLANPPRFLGSAERVVPWLAAVTLILLGVGLYLAFFVAPPDYQQGETVRIMFVHVPSAWLAMFGYMLMAVAALGTLIWRRAPR